MKKEQSKTEAETSHIHFLGFIKKIGYVFFVVIVSCSPHILSFHPPPPPHPVSLFLATLTHFLHVTVTFGRQGVNADPSGLS